MARAARPGLAPHLPGVISTDRHVSQFASWPALFAIEVDVGAGHGQAPGEQGDRVLAGRATENVDAGHPGMLGDGGSQGQVEYGAVGGSRIARSPPPPWSNGPNLRGLAAYLVDQ